MAFDVSFIYRVIDRYTPALKKIKAATAGFGRKVGQISGRALGGLAKGMGAVIAKGAAFATALSLGAVAFSVDRYADAADAIAKFSKQIGASADTVNSWRFAAERSGVSAGQMDKAMQRLFRNVGDFKNGTGELVTLLKGSPIFSSSLKDAATFDQQMDLVIGKLVKIKDPAQQAATAAKFFGERVGPKMIPLLKEGVGGIAQLRREALRLHGGFSKEGVAAAEKYKDTIFDFQFALTGLRDKIGAAVLPAMTKLVDGLKEMTVTNRDVIASGVATWFKNLATAVREIPWSEVIGQAKAFFGAAIRIVFAVDRIIKKLGGWKTAIAGLGIAAVLAPIIGLLLPIIKLVALVVAGFASLAGLPVAAIVGIGAVIAGLAAAIIIHWDAIKQGWSDLWGSAGELVAGFVDGVRNTFGGLFDFISSGFGTVGNLISGAASFFGIGGDGGAAPVAAGRAAGGNIAAGGAAPMQPVNLSGRIDVGVFGPGQVRSAKIASDPPGNLGLNVGSPALAGAR